MYEEKNEKALKLCYIERIQYIFEIRFISDDSG